LKVGNICYINLYIVLCIKVKKEEKAVKEESTWNVLRDDFMPKVTMRDWNKQASSDSELE